MPSGPEVSVRVMMTEFLTQRTGIKLPFGAVRGMTQESGVLLWTI